MATIKKDGNSMGLPMNINRGNPIPLDTTEVWYSLSDAQNYAQNGATAYVGQIIVVVNEVEKSAQAFMIANVEGELIEVGSGTGSAMIFVDTIAGLTTLGIPPTGVPNDLAIGQQAFVSADKKIYFLTATGSSAPTSYVWESQASDAPVWETNNGSDSSLNGKKVTFEYVHIMNDEYDINNYKEEGKIYYVTVEDPANGGPTTSSVVTSHVIFEGRDFSSSIVNLGNVDISTIQADSIMDNVLYVYEIVNPASTVEGKESGYYSGINIAIASGEGENKKLVPLLPNIVTDLDATEASPDNSGIPTVEFVLARISEISTNLSQHIEDNISYSNGKLSVGIVNPSSPKEIELTGVAHTPSVEGLKLTIPVYGGQDIVFDVPKDKFVTAGKYYETYPENPTEGETVYNKVIVLTIDNQVDPVIIPAEALVNTLTANNTGNSVAINISSSEISANVVIDPASGSALTNTANGLKLDISNKLDKLTDATGNKIVITNEDGTIDESAFVVQTSGTLSTTSTTDVPVAAVIASALNIIQNNLNEAKLDKLTGTAADAGKIVVVGEDGTTLNIGSFSVTSIENQINNKIDKVTDGTEDDITVLASDGSIKDSGVKIGGSSLSQTPNASTVATEAAVSEMFKWQEI